MTSAEQAADLLTTREVAEQYRIPNNTLRYWRHCGVGPASFTLGKRKVVYRRGEVERWISEQETSTTRGGAA